MKDVHSIETGGGGGGRLFAGGGDRRLRPHHHGQDLKCPRCESLNTKFCYYNNYNLSQPRHFCKSCRRYWTKGGVLRNVPVGGGIRKAKRSKPKSKNGCATPPRERKSSNSENSSSDSSSLTANTTVANTTATTTPIPTAEVSGSNSTNSTPTFLNFNGSSTRFFNTTLDPLMLNQSSAGNMLSEIGTFTSLMTSSTDQLPLGFNMASDISPFTLHQQNQNLNQFQWTQTGVNMPEMGSVDDDQIELSGIGSRRSNGGLAGTDAWQGGTADQGLFDLTGAVDQSYWSQSQWNGDDPQLNYLP